MGLVSLAPGTYIFRLSDSEANRHLVQVTNERGDHVYTTILAIPDYRLNATSKTVMYFSERPAGHPPAIKSWFYPGDNYGHRFVYPKAQAVQIAQETRAASSGRHCACDRTREAGTTRGEDRDATERRAALRGADFRQS